MRILLNEVESAVRPIIIISPKIDDCGPRVGVSTPGGNWSFIVESFSDTICRAVYTSVPQSNSTQTIEKPVADDERTRRTSVAPFTAVSTGNDTSFSTSSGANPGASVITTTVGAFKSGNMSTSVRNNTKIPAIIITIDMIKIVRRLSSENFIILLSIVVVFNGYDYVLQEQLHLILRALQL